MQLNSELEALFDAIQHFSRSASFIGTPVKVENITLLPILSMSFGAGGVGSGAAAGGKISPAALLVIKDEHTQLFSLNNQGDPREILGLTEESTSSSNNRSIYPHSDKSTAP